MSRSRRKFAVMKDGESNVRIPRRQRFKTIANRAVRRARSIPSGKGGFRKIYDSGAITYHRSVDFPDEAEALRRFESEKRRCVRKDLWIDRSDTPRRFILRWRKRFINK